jgi:hypothetical protein
MRIRNASTLLLDLAEHSLHMAMLLPRPKDPVALSEIAPLENLDRYPPYPPIFHCPPRRHVEIDGVRPRQRPSVVVHFENLTCLQHPEPGTGWPPRPICRRACHVAIPQRRAERRPRPMPGMITLVMRVGGGPYLLKFRAPQRRFELWQLTGHTSRKEQRWKEDAIHGSEYLHCPGCYQIPTRPAASGGILPPSGCGFRASSPFPACSRHPHRPEDRSSSC